MSDLISRQAAIEALCKRCDLVTGDPKRCTKKCNDIKMLEKLPSAQPEQQWIPVTERLPNKNGFYLVTMTKKAKEDDLGFTLDEIEARKMRYNSNGWILPKHIPSWINNAVTDEVTAWMPLPEPWKGED